MPADGLLRHPRMCQESLTGLDGQLNPIGAKVQAQVSVAVLSADRDHGGCHFAAVRERPHGH